MSLDLAAVRERVAAQGGRWGALVHHVEQTPSTQDLARKAAAEGAAEGTAFVADEQSQGRGRQGRPWVAPRGSALLASVVLRPAIRAQALPPLALAVGLALHDALAPRLPSAGLRIKWPNDLLVDGRKLAGVLVEASLRGDRPEVAVVGFGINLTRASLPDDIASRATCLEAHGASGPALDRAALLADALVALERRSQSFCRGGLAALLPELRAADGTPGRLVRWGDQQGVARGLADDGRLLIETPAGTVAASAGEVIFVG